MFYLRMALALTLFQGVCAKAQDVDSEVVHPNQRVTVANLPFVVANAPGKSASASAAVAIILGGENIKCDAGSQLETVVEANAEASLSALTSKIDGAGCSSLGRMQRVSASFTPNASIKANEVVASLLKSKPFLMQWKGSLYVLYGVVYDQHLFYSGRQDNVIRQFLLLDPRYRDKRRFVAFDRNEDDFREVDGVASINIY